MLTVIKMVGLLVGLSLIGGVIQGREFHYGQKSVSVKKKRIKSNMKKLVKNKWVWIGVAVVVALALWQSVIFAPEVHHTKCC